MRIELEVDAVVVVTQALTLQPGDRLAVRDGRIVTVLPALRKLAAPEIAPAPVYDLTEAEIIKVLTPHGVSGLTTRRVADEMGYPRSDNTSRYRVGNLLRAMAQAQKVEADTSMSERTPRYRIPVGKAEGAS